MSLFAPHTQSAEDVLSALHTTPDGLRADEIPRRLEQYGANELTETLSRPAWKMLWEQFSNPLILVLAVAAVLSFFIGDVIEGVAILSIVVLFGILGFIQELHAEQAIAALKQMSSPAVRVRRDGAPVEIAARDLVPGDIVLLETGNILPADLRLLDCANLSVMEAALTGESEPVRKQTDPLPGGGHPLGDRTNLAFMGTVVTQGRGTGVVIATGMHTEIGRIASLLQEIRPAPTPLQRKLANVGKQLSVAGVIAAACLFAIGMTRGETFDVSLLTAVSLLVAVVPEGLPAVITATLALGGRRMLRRHALIRKLPAVETLGAVTAICTDKTGTLTENRMVVTRIHTLHHDWQPRAGAGADPAALAEAAPLLQAAVLCNDSLCVAADPDAPARAPQFIGDPTETALLAVAAQLGLSIGQLTRDAPRLAEYAFDSDRKRMTTIHAGAEAIFADHPVFAVVKGAPDGLLHLATHVASNGQSLPITDAIRHQFFTANSRMAGEGLRVLAIAYRPLDAPPAPDAPVEAVESNLVFCGLVGIMDPPRAEVRDAIATCHAAGIRTIMITGDHPLTARAIAGQLDLAPRDTLTVLNGAELAALTLPELEEQADQIGVYARVSPEDKLRIVTALQTRGHVVAMTGDGVNDSPALKQAEIGVAMGITGTDVAKESAEMVLLDDNFSTIVAAVEEGRSIFDNLLRFIKYSFGGNLGKVLVMFLAPLAGLGTMALRPLHLLWLNLLTDGLMGLSLGLEPAESNTMTRPPRNPGAPIFNRPTLLHVLWMGVLICALPLLLAGAWHRHSGAPHLWQTVLFCAIGFAQMGQAWGLRSTTGRLFRFGQNPTLVWLSALTLLLQIAVIYIPPAARIFHLQPLPWSGLALTLLVGAATFGIVHIERVLRAKRHPHD